MADAPDPDGAEDGAKDDAAPAAATPPDQGSAMELELSQALIELRRLTLFQGPGFGEAIPRCFTMARLEDAQLNMRDLREENPAAATRASSPKGRAWLARVPAPVGCWPAGATGHLLKDFTEEEVAAMSAAMRHLLTSRLAAKARAEAEALPAEVSRQKKAEHQAKQITAAMEEAKKAAEKSREEALERLAKQKAEELRRADLVKATKASLGTADAAMDSGARASTDPAPGSAGCLYTAHGECRR